MIEGPQFKSPEDEIQFLESRIRNILQNERESQSVDKQKEVVATVVKEHVPQSIKSVKEESPMPTGEEAHETQIENLVKIAFDRGILHATSLARALEDPHMLDDFHAALVDKFHERLVESGVIMTEHKNE